ncbi:Aspartic protease 6 [Aphelenchoides besseyi]|nr:Aspartic protease 6 [Aphelenchoides besseyi]
MSSFLVVSLLIASALMVFVDAESLSVAIQAVKRGHRKNSLGLLNDVYSRKLSTYNNVDYYGIIYLGTPPVPFKVVSDDHFVKFLSSLDSKEGMQKCLDVCFKENESHLSHCSTGTNLYDPKASVTAKPTNTPFLSEYAKGHLYRDYFSFTREKRLKDPISFGAGEEMQHDDQAILGLASIPNPDAPDSSIMHEAWRQKLIDAPVFTIYMQKCPQGEDCKETGMITFGAYDELHCHKVERYVKINPGVSHWQFTVNEFRIAGTRISTPFKAIADSGTSHITAPTEVVEQILNGIGANAVEGGYIVKCDSNASITLNINGHEYTIPSREMLFNLHTGDCELLVTEYDDAEGLMILGNPFTRSFCQVHNIEKRVVGFAKIRQ